MIKPNAHILAFLYNTNVRAYVLDENDYPGTLTCTKIKVLE